MIILILLFYLFVGNGAAAAGTNGAGTKGIGRAPHTAFLFLSIFVLICFTMFPSVKPSLIYNVNFNIYFPYCPGYGGGSSLYNGNGAKNNGTIF